MLPKRAANGKGIRNVNIGNVKIGNVCNVSIGMSCKLCKYRYCNIIRRHYVSVKVNEGLMDIIDFLLPVQLKPFPWYPFLHVQLYDPFLLAQLAFSSHSCVP